MNPPDDPVPAPAPVKFDLVAPPHPSHTGFLKHLAQDQMAMWTSVLHESQQGTSAIHQHPGTLRSLVLMQQST